MKINKSVLFLLVIIAALIIPAISFAQSDYEKQTAVFSVDLAKKIKEKHKAKIAVSDFLDNEGSLTELGKAIAEEISAGIVNEAKDSFQVMERSSLLAIMKEQKLATTGLIDPETAKKLGKLKAADAIIVGNITPIGNSFRLVIKVLDTETGMSIAATTGNLSGTEDIKNLFNKKITLGNNATSDITTQNQEISVPVSKQETAPVVSKEKGDYCFKNVDRVGYKASVSIYKEGKSEELKSINVSYLETNCMYELPVGVYKVIVSWSDRWGNNIPNTTAEIKVKNGSEGTLELQH